MLRCNFDLCVDKHTSSYMISIQTGKAFFLDLLKKKACLDVANFGHSEQVISELSIDEGAFVFL